MINVLRRLLGESGELVAARRFGELLMAEIATLNADLDGCRAHNSALQQRVHRLTEPPPVESCSKIRLADKGEADDFARELERETGCPEGTMLSYACKVCPRRWAPGAKRWWHVAHDDPTERGKDGAQYARRPYRGASLDRKITPAQIAALQAKRNNL